MRLLLVGAAAIATAGCAAGRAGIQLQDATVARDDAREAGAKTEAVYELTMAERYLEKAWEEAGTGQYRMSVDLAKKSAEWSDQAVVQIARGERTLDVDLSDIEDTPTGQTPPTPPAPEAPAPEAPAPETPSPAPAPEPPADTPTPEAAPAPDAPEPAEPSDAAPEPPKAPDVPEVEPVTPPPVTLPPPPGAP